MFNHFEITFDLIDGIATAHTAAKGIKGESLFSYDFNLNEPQASPEQMQPTQIENVVDQAQMPIQAPA